MHENIVRVYNLEVLDGTAVLVMELLHGMDLKERLSRGGVLPIDETLRIGYPSPSRARVSDWGSPKARSASAIKVIRRCGLRSRVPWL